MIAEFLDHLCELDRNKSTVEGYAVDLAQFSQWFEQAAGKPFNPGLVTPLDVREWKRELIRQRLAPGTINRKIGALLTFFDWCVAMGSAVSNPAKNIKRLERVQNAPKWLTRQQTYALLRATSEAVQVAEAAGTPLQKLLTQRNAAMVALMLHAGLRVSEVCNLARGDIQLNERSGKVIVRRGKGGKYREVPLNRDARLTIGRWLQAYPKSGRVFSRNGKPLHQRTVQMHVAYLGEAAGLPEKLTPHQLRHTFGKNLTDAGVSLDRVAQLMGHSDVNTTRIYTVPSEADLQQAVELISWVD